MIDFLRGNVLQALPDRLIVLVGGVGYGVEVPLPLLCRRFSEGEELNLWVCTHVREDSIRLFGFQDLAERQTFMTLTGISGIGPRIGLAILSTLRIQELVRAIADHDIEPLKAVPGIGARTAEKIIVELKTKVDSIVGHLRVGAAVDKQDPAGRGPLSQGAGPASGLQANREVLADVKSALLNLGFKDAEVAAALDGLPLRSDGHDFQSVLKDVLAVLRQAKSGRKGTGTGAAPKLSELF